MIAPQRRAPSADALAWVAESLGPGTTIRSVRRLHGGIGAAVHRVTAETRAGAATTVVLRRWVQDERDALATCTQLVLHEQRALQLMEPTPVPAPRVLAVDPEGAHVGTPALLMSRLPGSIFLTPRDLTAWLHAVADTLCEIHAAAPDDGLPAFEPRAFSTNAAPDDSARPDLWRRARAVNALAAPSFTTVFRHGDYQHFNLLWSRERLTGVVDWTFPNRGPAGLDVGHCMLNLAVLFSADAAAEFRARYEAVSGSTIDPYWLVASLLRYSTDWQRFIPIQVHGKTIVDTNGMTARVERVLEAATRELS